MERALATHAKAGVRLGGIARKMERRACVVFLRGFSVESKIMNHGLYVFAFIIFSVYLFCSLVIHTDFKFIMLDFLARLFDKIEEDEDDDADE